MLINFTWKFFAVANGFIRWTKSFFVEKKLNFHEFNYTLNFQETECAKYLSSMRFKNFRNILWISRKLINATFYLKIIKYQCLWKCLRSSHNFDNLYTSYCDVSSLIKLIDSCQIIYIRWFWIQSVLSWSVAVKLISA